MKIDVKHAAELTGEEQNSWMALRRTNPALYSPYFHVGYTLMVGSLRPDAWVAIARDDSGEPIGFFPYQGPKKPKNGGFARPIGAPMTDYHGFVTGQNIDAAALLQILRGASIGAFDYDALVGAAPQTAQLRSAAPGCVIDISGGVEAWRHARDGSYKRHLKSNRRRIRKAEEEIGPRRFVFASKDPEVFEDLIRWKRGKFSQTGKYDVLSAGWTLKMLEAFWQEKPASLHCDMHALYFGDKLAAVDLGLSDGGTFHSWMVAYADAFHSYAPGIQLLEALIDKAPELGYSRLDLGTGLEGYKRHYGTENITAQSGFVPVSGPAAALAKGYGAAERFGEKKLADIPGKLRRRYSQIAACDDSLQGRARALFTAVKTKGGSANVGG